VKLPFAEQAVVPPRKITEYLLNPTHPEGGSKARFFHRRGYSLENVEQFRDALLALAETGEVIEVPTEFGPKYIGSGVMIAPDGRGVGIRTVWMLRDGLPPPILVTAYPG
jgi:hypothetical protein